MKNNRHLNTLELKLIEVFESVCNATVEEDTQTEQYYVGYDNFDEWTTDNKADLMAEVIRDLGYAFEDCRSIRPPKWGINFIFANADYNYNLTVEAEDRSEAIIKGIEAFNKECDWFYMPYEYIQVKEAETAEPDGTLADNIKIEYHNGNVYACKDLCSMRYEVGNLEPQTLDLYHINGSVAELITSKCREDMTPKEYDLYKALHKAMTAEAEKMCRYYEEPKTECFYTGGGFWCTVYQLSGVLSDYYYGFGSEQENGCMCLYSHKADAEYGDAEYAMGGVVKWIDIDEATEAEKEIYWQMAKCEEETLRANGQFTEAYQR